MPTPLEPTQLGDYRLLEPLGHGGMAQVFRGERVAEAGFKKKVALKRMLPQYRRNPSLLERFAAEARTNARLDHPNLVQVVDFGTDPEPYLVMEFVEGITLADLLARLSRNGVPMELAAACFVAAEAAQGLDHAHRKRDESGKPLGIVHRDVSPQNVLLGNEGAVKVSDFGLVKAADNVVQTGTGMPIGKLSYMAPEQAAHTSVDARADVFSLGVVTWEMLTLRPLIPPNDPAQASVLLASCEFAPPSAFNPRVSSRLDQIVMGCLVREPDRRTPSAQALGDQLREVLHELAPGYGRTQLARLLSWAFPEKGWVIDEPYETAAQPSDDERSPEVARLSLAHPPVAPAAAPAVAPTPRKSQAAALWLIGLGLGVIVAALAVVALGVFWFALQETEDGDRAAPAAQTMNPQPPAPAGLQRVVEFDSNVVGSRFYLGPRSLGIGPVALHQRELDGNSLVVVARGYNPVVVAPERLAQLFTQGSTSEHIELRPTRRPIQVVYVQHPRPGVARVGYTRRVLGTVPGVLTLPARMLTRSLPIEVVETNGRRVLIDIDNCQTDEVCVVSEGVL